MTHRGVIDRAMEEVMADHLVLQCLEGVSRVAFVAAMQPFPVDEVSAAGAAFAPLVGRHLLELLEAVQIVVAIGRRAFDVEGRWLLELGHVVPQLRARSSSCRSSSLSMS